MKNGYDIAEAEFSISNRSMFTKAERAEYRAKESELIYKAKHGEPFTDLIKFWTDKKELMLARVQSRYERIEMAKAV